MIVQEQSLRQQEGKKLEPKLNLRRLFRWLFLTFILPMSLAVAFDFLLGLRPFITILAIVVVIPLATFFVVRVVIDELSQVLKMIAPEESISPPLQEVET
ncbi:MAG: hypothetical protein U0175_15070 [Caldilineaceae bacterium]